MKLKIDPEFQKLIPPLTPEELAQLEANILADGCREPLTVWQETGILLDGHNRYAICQEHGLDYDTWPLTLADRLAAKEWIIRNQFGRRNLPTLIHLELSGELEKVIAERAKQNLAAGGARGGSANKPLTMLTKACFDESPDGADTNPFVPEEETSTTPVNTRKEIAKAVGVSEGTIHKYKKLAAAPNYDAARARILAGETSINAEYTKLKVAEKQAAVVEKIAEIKANPIPTCNVLPELVLADPPWDYGPQERTNRAVENHYPTASLEEIINHKPKTADNCILLLWTTMVQLPTALHVMEKWGFNYKTGAVWDKQKIGIGYWFRGQHELLLVGLKGDVSPPAVMHRTSSVFSEQSTKHSKKPECVYKWIEEAFFDKPKLEMYCREPRQGWMVWGNEI